MTLTDALTLADHDSPLPHLAGEALRVLRAEIERLRAMPQAVQAPTYGYFSFDDQRDFELHGTLAEAVAAADKALDYCRDVAIGDGGWPEEVEQICYGQILGRVVETDRTPWNEDERGPAPEDGCEYVDYALLDAAPEPPQTVGVPVGVEGVRADYRPAFDTPTTAAEALAWLSKQGEPTCMTFSTDSARRAAELLRDALHQTPADSATASVFAELGRAVQKFPTWPTDPLHAVAVLGEEFGELTKAVLQSVYEPHKVKPGEVRTEALQTAAMALRFLRSLHAYEFTPGAQHNQAPLAQQPAAVDEAQSEAVRARRQQIAGWLEGLEGAARSLRTIADQAGKGEGLDDMQNVRGYANSRATVAEAALTQQRGRDDDGA